MLTFKKITFLCLSVFLSIYSIAQYKLSCRIENYAHREVKVFTLFGDEAEYVESVQTNINSAFEFSFDKKEVGLYRLYLDNNEYFDLIFNNENIQLSTFVENPVYNMKVIESNENFQLYEFLKMEFMYKYKIQILEQFMSIYPDETFTKTVEKEKAKQLKEKNDLLIKVINLNKNSFAGKYLTYFKEVTAPEKLSIEKKQEFYRKEYLKSYDFSSVLMLKSNAYQKVVLDYLKLFRATDVDVYYVAGKDVLDHIFFEEPVIFNTIFEFILNGFETIGLVEQSSKLSLEFGDLCSDASDNLKARIKANTELTTGKKAPDFTVQTLSGQTYTLSKMKSNYTLILFWATWCGHCQLTIPTFAEAQQLFDAASVDIIAISLDKDKKELNEFLSKNPFPWNIACDYKSWDGKQVIDYSVYATPIMYLVDKDLNIVAKPYDEQRLFRELEKILYRN